VVNHASICSTARRCGGSVCVCMCVCVCVCARGEDGDGRGGGGASGAVAGWRGACLAERMPLASVEFGSQNHTHDTAGCSAPGPTGGR